jgi:hypothetical protein
MLAINFRVMFKELKEVFVHTKLCILDRSIVDSTVIDVEFN